MVVLGRFGCANSLALGVVPGKNLDAVVIVVDIICETLATPARSTSACPVPDTGTA